MAEECAVSKSEKGLPFGLGILNVAWNWRWALKLCCMLLFVDVALIGRFGSGLLNWSFAGRRLSDDAVFLLVVMTLFSLIAAILTPLLCSIVRQLLGAIPGVYSFSDESPPFHYVSSSIVHERAVREQDEFMYRRYEEHIAEQARYQRMKSEMGELVFLSLILAATNYFTHGYIILSTLAKSGDWGMAVAMLTVMGCLVLLKSAWFNESGSRWIYYPQLAEERPEKSLAFGSRRVPSYLRKADGEFRARQKVHSGET